MKFSVFVETDELSQLYNQDQAERKEYQSYLSKFPNWKQAVSQWIRTKKRDPNDVFNDKSRLQIAKRLIQINIKSIKQSPEMLNKAWLLVQHMDNDIPFQQWFIQHLKENSNEYRYLTDRILVNKGMKQKYGTQNQSNN